jgi:predicted dinucleotide-utilizing enzyme
VSTEARRVALIGYGHIGRALCSSLRERPEHFAVVAVLVRERSRTVDAPIPAHVFVDRVEQLREARPDLVVEAAHPDVTRRWGAEILAFADYLPLSLTALADPGRLDALAAVAESRGRSLLIPHGAVVGGDSLVESREQWDEVEIEFRKHPSSIRRADGTALAPDRPGPVTLFDGSVREIAQLFPLNVNAMVACALMTVGLDRCRARLVADPTTTLAHLRILARGRDGSVLDVRRDQPVVGVSGTEMARSLLRSVLQVPVIRSLVTFV